MSCEECFENTRFAAEMIMDALTAIDGLAWYAGGSAATYAKKFMPRNRRENIEKSCYWQVCF